MLVALALAVGLLTPIAALPTPSAHAVPGCVTKGEFRQVASGRTLLWVEARFDTHGRLEHQGGGYKTKSYRPCWGPDTGRYQVTYRHYRQAWRLDWKSYSRFYCYC
ncbi:hypothetical protein MF406_18030 (plasmid) [Georgenia sp. TF02-10]|uniref:hypothetical protein n=1 Tax=Georgenia sp. TF02-10 TaxID=2917725 RepID=UPI001FA7ABA8|nr:hypothetical protein [Georgenia sp. TF02-10]UNX56552.1 hypothetical protein MF406_18030 [Georgenia sp. TF02-10]